MTISVLSEEQFLERTRDFADIGPHLDAGIRHFVRTLYEHGVETFESCEGGAGHAFPEPTIRFHGGPSAGYRALAIALEHALPVSDLFRQWSIIDGEATGPYWYMTFYRKANDNERGCSHEGCVAHRRSGDSLDGVSVAGTAAEA